VDCEEGESGRGADEHSGKRDEDEDQNWGIMFLMSGRIKVALTYGSST
jgi:hypothetical protein